MFDYSGIRINVLNCFKRKTFRGYRGKIIGDFSFGKSLVLHIEGSDSGVIDRFEITDNGNVIELDYAQTVELKRLISALVEDELLTQ